MPRDIIRKLELKPHPEGGYYSETYRSAEMMNHSRLPSRYSGDRNFCTAIYFLITDSEHSNIHKLASDEIFHFYSGDPALLLQLGPDGAAGEHTLGPDIERGHSPQVLVRAGTWQGVYVKPGGSWTLMGCTVSPGFDFSDFELGKREGLLKQYPEWEESILKLTGPG